MTLLQILCLYLVFRAKQLVCDFLLQTQWMALEKGRPFGSGGGKPLAAHVTIHAVATLVIMLVFAPALWWLGIVDFLVHGLIDRIKSIIGKKKGWTYEDRWFWWSLGIDQEAHNLTHLAYIVIVVMHHGGL